MNSLVSGWATGRMNPYLARALWKNCWILCVIWSGGAVTGGRCRGAGSGARIGVEDSRGSAISRSSGAGSAGGLDGGMVLPRAGHSPDIRRSLSSKLVPWCLGGPRGDGSWTKARTDDWWWHHPPLLQRKACRTPQRTRRRGDFGELGWRTERRFPCRERNKGGNKTFSQKNNNSKTRGKEAPLIVLYLLSWILSRSSR